MSAGLNGGLSPTAPAMRRARKAMIESDPEDESELDGVRVKMEEGQGGHSNPTSGGGVNPQQSSAAASYSMDTDISKLEAPTFTTLDTRGPSQKMMELSWDHRVNLIGKKVVNPMIHNCDQCDAPILIYGRMIPCKHVFCYKCALAAFNQPSTQDSSADTRTTNASVQGTTKRCPRCKDKVVRVEQAGLGSIYMCQHGGSRYGSNGCRRTYLSQRDLQAHIHHRHVKVAQQQAAQQAAAAQQQQGGPAVVNSIHERATAASAGTLPPNVPSAAAIAAATAAIVANRSNSNKVDNNSSNHQQPLPTYHPNQQPHPSAAASAAQANMYSQPPPTVPPPVRAAPQAPTSNLITVIGSQQDPSSAGAGWQHQPSASQAQQHAASAASAYTQPPPNFHHHPPHHQHHPPHHNHHHVPPVAAAPPQYHHHSGHAHAQAHAYDSQQQQWSAGSQQQSSGRTYYNTNSRR